MMKITKKIMLLVLCLGLTISSTLFILPGSVNAADGEPAAGGEEIAGSSNNDSSANTAVSNAVNGTNNDEGGSKDTQQINDPQGNIKDLNDKVKELDGKVATGKFVSYLALILSIVSSLLSIVAVGALIRTNKFSRTNLLKMKKRMTAIENQVEELNNILRTLEKEIRSQDVPRPTPNPMPPMPSPTPVPPVPKPVPEPMPTPKPEPVPAPVLISQYFDSKKRDVFLAYQSMRDKISRGSNFEGIQIKKSFAKEYGVHGFKCVNSQQRVNNRDLPPTFTETTLTESTLWGIPLQDGTLAIFPNLRNYESSVHYQGGMKELFRSDYKNGSFNRIEVKKPALVKYDYQAKTFDSGAISQPGELLLSWQP